MPKADSKTASSRPRPAIILRCFYSTICKGLDLESPLVKLTVVSCPSGSGKSSLAFHTLYAEGQRRYVETFSPYVRQFFDRMDKPAVDHIDGIPPAIAIEQKNSVRTTRSTVGTLTEINDYLKLLFARLAIGHDPATGETIQPDSPRIRRRLGQGKLNWPGASGDFSYPLSRRIPKSGDDLSHFSTRKVTSGF